MKMDLELTPEALDQLERKRGQLEAERKTLRVTARFLRGDRWAHCLGPHPHRCTACTRIRTVVAPLPPSLAQLGPADLPA